MEQLKNRVQIWMDQDDFVALKKFLETSSEPVLDEGGPFDELFAAIEQAWCNNSNYDIVEEDE